MLTVLDLLTAWFAGWSCHPDQALRIELVHGDHNAKLSQWLIVEGPSVSGQLTLWETGECDLEAYRNDDSTEVILRSEHLATVDDLLRVISELYRACNS